MLKYDAVLFDLDGVLVDACDWHYESLNRALKIIVGFEIPYEDHMVKYNGLPTAVKLRMLGLKDCTATKVEAMKQILTIQTIKQRAKIMPEKLELHLFLKDQGIKIACVTNSINKTANEMLIQTGQIGFMDIIVSNNDVKKNKPYPDCYNFAVKKLGVDPMNCLCVEDSTKGIEAAKTSVVPNLWIVSNSSDVTLKNYKMVVA